jgi:hypothetical protein
LEGQTCLLSGGAPDSHCSCLVRDLLPFLVHPTVGPWGQLAHQTLYGAHRTVRCAQPTVVAGHASPADCAANHCAGDRWLTGQSGEFYPYTANLFLRAAFSPETSLAHRTLSGAPPDSPVCQTGLKFGCTEPSLSVSFLLLLSLFLALR